MPKNDGASPSPLTSRAGGLAGSLGTDGLPAYNDLAPGASLAAPLGNSNVLEQIMTEIRRIQSGAPPRDALLAELGGGA